MNRLWLYIVIWALMILATFVQIYVVRTSASAAFKNIAVIIIAAIEAVTAAAYYQNLRHEPKVMSLLPVSGLLVITTLVIVSLTGGA